MRMHLPHEKSLCVVQKITVLWRKVGMTCASSIGVLALPTPLRSPMSARCNRDNGEAAASS